MASAGGLTRRRGAAQAATDEEESSSGRVASPAPKSTPSYNDRSPETSYSSGENGHKIAFDPRDISESEERSKQPKLTLMEEILLLGLKDKQVRLFGTESPRFGELGAYDASTGLLVFLE
jgi:golgi phosphoprotein 3